MSTNDNIPLVEPPKPDPFMSILMELAPSVLGRMGRKKIKVDLEVEPDELEAIGKLLKEMRESNEHE